MYWLARDRVEAEERNTLFMPLQVASRIALCSRPAAWIALMIMPHIPSWPTTSYSGDRRTKNSSVAFATPGDLRQICVSSTTEKKDVLNPYSVAPMTMNASPRPRFAAG